MLVHSCFKLIKTRAAMGWQSVPNGLRMTLQCGSSLGMLCVSFEYECGCKISVDYFFSLNANDLVFRVMSPEIVGGRMLSVTLPCGNTGLFKKTSSNNMGFNDAYVLRTIVCANDHDPSEFTLHSVFQSIAWRVGMRASLRVWKRFARRQDCRAARLVAIHVLHMNDIQEVSLRHRIVRLAGLW